MQQKHALIAALGLTIVLAGGLTDSRSTALASQPDSTPIVYGVVPAAPAPDPDPQTLTVNGKDFQPRLVLIVTTPEGARMRFKDELILAPTESSFRVAVVFATVGKYQFVVTNPDGGVSMPFVVDVKVPMPAVIPMIDSIGPESIVKGPEAQDVLVTGRNFGPGLRAIVTDPQGAEVLNPVIRDLTSTTFTLNVLLENAGRYSLVVSTAKGATSKVATIVVR